MTRDYAAMCKALGEPTRLAVFECLAQCEACEVEEDGCVHEPGASVGTVCCSVAEGPQMLSRVSFHIDKLRQAGLVTSHRHGKSVICSIDRAAVRDLIAYLENVAGPKHKEESQVDSIQETVRQKYGEIAAGVLLGNKGSCCGPDEITTNLYNDAEAGEVPADAINASLGCGNPTALATLNPGETVLDLGSGGGIDVLLSARRVGPTGFAYGLDMTDEMLALAEKNRTQAGAENVKFLKGTIEDIPLPDSAVDVVISNCVINLSTDKGKTLKEAFRVLKPGGRFAVSDVVVRGKLPEATRQDMEAYVGCVAGALERDEYEALLRDAGFTDIEFQVTREYSFEGACCGGGSGCGSNDGNVVSAFVRASKP